jgi:hypothetical protein
MSGLARVAILGTSQVPSGEALSTGTPADSLLARLKLEGPDARELELLFRAGSAAVVRRAGFAPRASVEITTEPAPDESLRRASPRLGALLVSLFGGEPRDVLPEALSEMKKAGIRLPEELLPQVLGERDRKLRQLLLPVLGERGHWLAGQAGGVWGWARGHSVDGAVDELPVDAEQRWAEGSALERAALLALARRLAPARGRAWVESTFRVDKPEQRRTWLGVLEIGLSLDDLPFLEAAMNDRSQTVRVAAARVAWLLPESRVAQAVRERAGAAVRVVNGELEIELPPEPFDKELERLGIAETPPHGAGRRQFWLAQLLAALPPDELVERSGASPAELIAAARRHELGEALLQGFTSAALRFRASAWYAPLWDAWAAGEGRNGWVCEAPLEALSERLPAEELEPRLIACLENRRDFELLDILPRPWPAPIAETFLSLVRRRTPLLLREFPLGASRIPVELVPADFKPDPREGGEGPDFYDQSCEAFSSTIEFRRRLLEEIAR